jgi:hypothetical protein
VARGLDGSSGGLGDDGSNGSLAEDGSSGDSREEARGGAGDQVLSMPAGHRGWLGIGSCTVVVVFYTWWD